MNRLRLFVKTSPIFTEIQGNRMNLQLPDSVLCINSAEYNGINDFLPYYLNFDEQQVSNDQIFH